VREVPLDEFQVALRPGFGELIFELDDGLFVVVSERADFRG
jgi:hypothetical protein